MEATNNRAERAIRYACHQQGKDSFVMLVDLWRNQSKVLEVLPGSLSPPVNADAQVTEESSCRTTVEDETTNPKPVTVTVQLSTIDVDTQACFP
jgi:hypothetical protein